MTYNNCGFGAASTAVAYRTDEELGLDFAEGCDPGTLTFTNDGNMQHVSLAGTDAEVLDLLDRARAVVRAHMAERGRS